MKKIFITAACFLLMLICCPVFSQAIPDPARFLGSSEKLYEKNAEYEGIRYDVYIYSLPASEQDFNNAYLNAAINAGYTVGKTQVDGFSALSVSAQFHENSALLLYNYRNNMLFLVPTDMFFVLQGPDTSPVTDPLYLDMISYVTKYLNETRNKQGNIEPLYGLSEAFAEPNFDRQTVKDYGYCLIDINRD